MTLMSLGEFWQVKHTSPESQPNTTLDTNLKASPPIPAHRPDYSCTQIWVPITSQAASDIVSLCYLRPTNSTSHLHMMFLV